MKSVAVAPGHREAFTSGRRWHRRFPAWQVHDPSATISSFPLVLVLLNLRWERTVMKRASRLSVLLLSAILIAGCAARGVRIAELKDQPGKYDDKSVSVTGVVTSSWGIPLVPFQLYKVDDGTGEITVLSKYGRTPSKGQRVKVKGRINEFAVFGGRSIGLHIQEEDRDYRSSN
jgi:hypothetical protein